MFVLDWPMRSGSVSGAAASLWKLGAPLLTSVCPKADKEAAQDAVRHGLNSWLIQCTVGAASGATMVKRDCNGHTSRWK